MNGRTDGPTGIKSVFRIPFFFKYINQLNVPISKNVLKVVYGFYIRSYQYFKFQN